MWVKNVICKIFKPYFYLQHGWFNVLIHNKIKKQETNQLLSCGYVSLLNITEMLYHVRNSKVI